MDKSEETATDSLDKAFQDALAEHSTIEKEQTVAATEPVNEASGETKADEETPPEQQTEKAADAPKETAEDQLLSEEEFAALGKDPKAILKGMNRAFTQKTQALAAERKALAESKELVDEYKTNPKEVLRKLAEEHGFTLQTKGDKPAAIDQDTTKEAAANTNAILREALGPELQGLADALTPAIEKLVSLQAGSLIEKKVKPLEDSERSRQAEEHTRRVEAARTSAKADLESLGTRHKDWKQFEPKMFELSHKILPGKDMTPAEYLDSLYFLASKDAKAAVVAKKVIGKINRVADAAESASSGAPTHTVSSTPNAPNLDESIKMAMRGETVDAD